MKKLSIIITCVLSVTLLGACSNAMDKEEMPSKMENKEMMSMDEMNNQEEMSKNK